MTNHSTTNTNALADQRGFASIVIALTLVIILALITVSFAQLTRREQRNALNKQLATQAYYAAETGISDAVSDIKAGHITTSNTGTCTPTYTPVGYPAKSTTIDSTLGVSYSCVSIDLNPTMLNYTKVDDSAYHSVSFTSAVTVSSLTVSWTSTTGKTAPASVGGLLTKSAWTAPALMEVSLTSLSALDHDSLAANNFTTYGYPTTAAGQTSSYTGGASSTDEGVIKAANCSAGTCKLTITGIGVTSLLLHITDHYDQSNISVTGVDTSGNPVKFQGGQAIIDSTGRARTVLKRLQVHVPLGDSPILPNYAIEAQNVCKRITTFPNAAPSTTSTDLFHVSTSPGVGGTAVAPDPCFLN